MMELINAKTTRPRALLAECGIALALGILLANSAFGTIISPDRIVPWVPGVTVGVRSGVPARTNLIDATRPPYNADKTGQTNASSAINAAISAANSNDVVYLPAGNYLLQDPVTLKSFVTVRGAGMTNTIVHYVKSWGNAFAMGTGWNWLWNNPSAPNNSIVSGFSKGSSNLVFASTSPSWVQKLCLLNELNDTNLPVLHTMGYERCRGQLTLITAVNGNTVTIWPPLYWNMQTNLNPHFAVASLDIRFAGLEDLTVDSTNATTGSPLVMMTQGFNCWYKGVKVSYCVNWAFGMTDSLHCEMRQCWVDKSLGGATPNHAGLLMCNSSACLVEDNIFDNVFPLIEVNRASGGNAFTFNFANQTYWGVSLDGNHNPHNQYNLWEGNVAANFSSDGYFGSASEDTLFRNWFHTEAPYGTPRGIWALKFCRFSRNENIVGNVLGTSKTNISAYGLYELGQPNMGNETWTGFGPPWQAVVRDPGAITFSQSNFAVTASAPFFYATNVSWFIQDRTDGGVITIDSYVSSTVVMAVSYQTAYRTNHSFVLAPGPSGWQEMDTNVLATAFIKGNYSYPVSILYPGSVWPTNDPNVALSAGEVLPASLVYANGAPSWWGANNWPAIGPDQTPVNGMIPALLRYLGLPIGTRANLFPPDGLRVIPP